MGRCVESCAHSCACTDGSDSDTYRFERGVPCRYGSRRITCELHAWLPGKASPSLCWQHRRINSASSQSKNNNGRDSFFRDANAVSAAPNREAQSQARKAFREPSPRCASDHPADFLWPIYQFGFAGFPAEFRVYTRIYRRSRALFTTPSHCRAD